MVSELIEKDDYLAHYGILRRSGRYPWGSGSTENVRNREFLAYFDKIKSEGNMSITEACKMVGISTTEYRAARTIAKAQQKQQQIHQAQKLRDQGWSHTAIAEKMFGTKSKESTIRSLLADDARAKIDALHNVSRMLEEGVASKRFIDIGTGVEQHLGIAESRLKAAVAVLKEKGYMVHKVQVDQLGTAPGNKTTIRVLTPPGTTYKELNARKGEIQQLDALGKFSKDNGKTILGIKPPLSISSRRVGIIYADQGGKEADGVIYVRPGVKDVSLGSAHYAQVRIMVDGTHYLKGMAVYKPDMPKGVDLQFNTNKNPGGSKIDVMKELKKKDDGTIDSDNPFGAQIRPNGGQVIDEKTGKVTSVMNKINEEGNWDTWSDNLSSQFLSKQSPTLARRQLQATYDAEREKLDEIMQLTNPAVRAKLLESFADGADSSAVHLKAAALPGQASRVILPIPTMKETEVYAPTYKNGDRVVLIRYPHGGTFEIPELTVNNRHKLAREAFGEHPPDAIGINPKVAAKLSGADFDGDSVIVIPQRPGTTIKSSPSLEELKHFDPQREYPPYDGMKTIDGGRWDAKASKIDYGVKPDGTPGKTSPSGKQQHMGKVSNLITDMTIRGASNDELARAVKHSMVVIDAEKHSLDYKASEIDNGIKALQQKYQPRPGGQAAGGASTLISRAGSVDRQARAVKQRGIDPITGRRILVPKGEEWVDPVTGKTRFPTAPRKKLEIAEDAFALTSGGSKEKPGTSIEAAYAEHSNRMKALANLARKELVNTKLDKAVPSATRAYDQEVKSLTAKLNQAIQNRPLERQAQIYANTTLAQKRVDLPDMDAAQIKRVKFQALQQARSRVGAGKDQIQITPQEWTAIQARAISPSKLKSILDNADLETVKKLATPRQTTLMGGSQLPRAKAMLASGHTQAEVAQALGVSLTTLKNSLRGES
jgi:hypothetical protein